MSFIRPNKPVAETVPQEKIQEASGTSLIKSLKNHNTILEVSIKVTEVFNGTNPTASIGIDTDNDKYLLISQCNLKQLDTFIIEDTVILTSDENIKVYITPDGSTTGNLLASVKYLDT